MHRLRVRKEPGEPPSHPVLVNSPWHAMQMTALSCRATEPMRSPQRVEHQPIASCIMTASHCPARDHGDTRAPTEPGKEMQPSSTCIVLFNCCSTLSTCYWCPTPTKHGARLLLGRAKRSDWLRCCARSPPRRRWCRAPAPPSTCGAPPSIACPPCAPPCAPLRPPRAPTATPAPLASAPGRMSQRPSRPCGRTPAGAAAWGCLGACKPAAREPGRKPARAKQVPVLSVCELVRW